MSVDLEFYEVKEGKCINQPLGCVDYHFLTCGYESVVNLGRNNIFMEWMERYYGVTIEDDVYYLVTRDDLQKLLVDCKLVIDFVKEVTKGHTVEWDERIIFTEEMDKCVKSLFPNKSWNKYDYGEWDEELKMRKPSPHYFNGADYECLLDIVDKVKNLSEDKYFFKGSW